MSDEYKDRYNIRTLLMTLPSYYRQCNNTLVEEEVEEVERIEDFWSQRGHRMETTAFGNLEITWS